MMELVLVLRGVAAVWVLATLTGGVPHVVRVGLAVVIGVWAAALAGPQALTGFSADPAMRGGLDGLLVGLGSRDLLVVAVRELVVGATLGIAAAVPLLAVAVAGRLVDRAAGPGRAGDVLTGPYRALFSVLAAAVFVGVDGHVSFMVAIVGSFREVPVNALGEARVVTTLARLVPAAVQLAIPWLVTAAVVEIAAGVAVRIAGRAAADGVVGAAPPAALVMMTATLVGTLAVAISALVR